MSTENNHTYLGKPVLPGLSCCDKDANSIVGCIVKSCLSLIYYHLDNPESDLSDIQKNIINELVKSIESTLNRVALKPGDDPKSMREVLSELLQQKEQNA